MHNRSNPPELMSPAGHWPQLQAAIEAGADAVYFGLQHFSARAKVGFTLRELPDVMRTLHERGVKGFVTFNTLVFDHELHAAREALVEICRAGADAIIAQDIGVVQVARQVTPQLQIHGSTQMSVTSAEGVELAASFGCSRVVLGRELSLADIRRIVATTDIELEVFVHGALCVSYSGQCFSSEAWGGRSANRGKCAQACRLSYDLMVDGQPRDLGADRYLLSPGDLYAIEQVPQLVELGIACLKIEGRYKDADYVALTTRAYRQAIDRAVAGREAGLDEVDRGDLEQIYSRGLGPHFISGVNHQKVVVGRAPRHRGRWMGTVLEVESDSLLARLQHSVRPGDGLVFDAADWRSPDEPEEGGNVYEVIPVDGGTFRMRFGANEIDFSRIRPGDRIWRTRDPQLSRKLRPITTATQPLYTRPLAFRVSAVVGKPLTIRALSETGDSAEFIANSSIVAAQSKPLELSILRQQLGRLGGTPFHLGDVQLEGDSNCFVPVSELNAARRSLVESILDERRTRLSNRICRPAAAAFFPDRQDESGKESGNHDPGPTGTARLHLLVRTPEQLEAAVGCRPASITLDYLELYGLRPSVERVRKAGLVPRVASPRILKPSEQKVVRFLLSLDCSILVRSGGLLQGLVKNEPDRLPELIGDFSLNAANAITTQILLDIGLDRVTPTYDLNARQIVDLSRSVNPQRIEVIAYSHLPVFHTEHCVFCRFLSTGTDHTNCGHPCEKHQIAVRDGQGRQHPVMADVGCRNTVFGAEAQVDPEYLPNWTDAGIRDLRLEFVHQSANEVEAIHDRFARFLQGELTANELGRDLARLTPQGITRGSLFVARNFNKLVQLN